MTKLVAGSVAILDIYSTVTSPDPAQAFIMGPADDIANTARSLGALLKSGRNGIKSMFVTSRTAAGQVQPLGVFAIIDRSTLRTGSRHQHDILPPGWDALPAIPQVNYKSRAHLQGNVVGGRGGAENLVTFYQSANLRMRDQVENKIVESLERINNPFDEVYYLANPIHNGVVDYPVGIEVIAFGVRNGQVESTPFIAVTILNQP
jgi:hypothetical protein